MTHEALPPKRGRSRWFTKRRTPDAPPVVEEPTLPEMTREQDMDSAIREILARDELWQEITKTGKPVSLLRSFGGGEILLRGGYGRTIILRDSGDDFAFSLQSVASAPADDKEKRKDFVDRYEQALIRRRTLRDGGQEILFLRDEYNNTRTFGPYGGDFLRANAVTVEITLQRKREGIFSIPRIHSGMIQARYSNYSGTRLSGPHRPS